VDPELQLSYNLQSHTITLANNSQANNDWDHNPPDMRLLYTYKLKTSHNKR
jgi:hypothetical protein